MLSKPIALLALLGLLIGLPAIFLAGITLLGAAPALVVFVMVLLSFLVTAAYLE